MPNFLEVDVPEGAVALHWFEQSSFALKNSDGTTILVDPYFPQNRPAEQFVHPEPPIQEAEFPTDLVLLTHNHGDHTCIESLQRLEDAWQPKCYIGPIESVGKIVAEMVPGSKPMQDEAIKVDLNGVQIKKISKRMYPIDKTIVAVANETISCHRNGEEFTIYPVYSKPPEGDPNAQIAPPDVTHLGYVIDFSGVSVYISGDPINNFHRHDNLVDPILALEPDIGFLTTHPTEGEFPFFAGSLATAKRLKLKHAVPVHRACFVTRDYDPDLWAEPFGSSDPTPLVMERNSCIIYPN